METPIYIIEHHLCGYKRVAEVARDGLSDPRDRHIAESHGIQPAAIQAECVRLLSQDKATVAALMLKDEWQILDMSGACESDPYAWDDATLEQIAAIIRRAYA
jgi:hypothetical protein